MKKYRQLFEGQDTLRVGDQFSNRGADIQAETNWSTLNPCHVIAFMPGNIYRREVPAHNWISFKDRQPTAADALNISESSIGLRAGDILIRFYDGSAIRQQWDAPIYVPTDTAHWMALNFVKETRPVEVDGHALVPQKDGSVKISCGTVIPKEDVEEFLRQRNEVMK